MQKIAFLIVAQKVGGGGGGCGHGPTRPSYSYGPETELYFVVARVQLEQFPVQAS